MESGDNDTSHVYRREYAVSLDAQDPLRNLRDEFLIPSKAQLKAKTLSEVGEWIVVG
jgi:kynureninase